MLTNAKGIHSPFEDVTHLFANTIIGGRGGILKRAASVLHTRGAGAIEFTNDDLLRVCRDDEIWVVRDDHYLPGVLALAEIVDQARVFQVVEKLLGDVAPLVRALPCYSARFRERHQLLEQKRVNASFILAQKLVSSDPALLWEYAID